MNENHLNSTVVGLTNPKSPSNVGSVMRAAGCYQVGQVFYSGQRYARAAKFNTDTKSITDKIPLSQIDDLSTLKSDHQKLVVVELVEGAIPLPEFEHPENAVYIFGPEDGSIEQNVVDAADHVVYIPTIGCMNLAATVNVVLYDRLAKQSSYEKGDELIRGSRDKNNNVRVKI